MTSNIEPSNFGPSNHWKNKKVIVTGGSGFLGSFVIEKLKQRGATDLAGQSSACAVRGLSRTAVRKHVQSDLHDLSHGREIRRAETVSALAQLSHEVRSLAAYEDGKR